MQLAGLRRDTVSWRKSPIVDARHGLSQRDKLPRALGSVATAPFPSSLACHHRGRRDKLRGIRGCEIGRLLTQIIHHESRVITQRRLGVRRPKAPMNEWSG